MTFNQKKKKIQERDNIDITRGKCFFPIPVCYSMWRSIYYRITLPVSLHPLTTNSSIPTSIAPTHFQEEKHVICEFGRRNWMSNPAPSSFLILGGGNSSLLLWELMLLLLGEICCDPVLLCRYMCLFGVSALDNWLAYRHKLVLPLVLPERWYFVLFLLKLGFMYQLL